MKSGVLPERLLSKRGAVEGKVKTLKSYKVKEGHRGRRRSFTFLLFGFSALVLRHSRCDMLRTR